MSLLKSPLLRDPLFYSATLLYLLNRLILKDALPESWIFFDYYLNDVLLIPCALPPVLATQYLLKLRPTLDKPVCTEVMLHLFIWAVICELIGPYFIQLGTPDIYDILAYTIGAILSTYYWSIPPRYQQQRQIIA